MFTFVVEMGNSRSDSKTIPQQVERRAATGLAESIRTGCMVDTKVLPVFEEILSRWRKSSKGDLCELGNSAWVQRTTLDLLLVSHGFKGSETVPLDLFELKDEDMETDEYDYPGEDSDLEWEGPPGPPPNIFFGSVPSWPASSPLPSDAPVPVAEDCSPHLAGSEFRELIEAPMCQPEDISSCDPATPPTSVGQKDDEDGDGDKAKPTNEVLTVALTHVQTVTEKNFMRMGRVIVIKDTAFATWEALVRYIYFNEIHFDSLGAWPAPAQGRCSPKSMYRLADKFGIQTLKDLALENIKTQLSVQNVTREVFSRFSSL
ncbi:hypothetical protein BDZ89DRAFT_119560 [Hymenopellis radicata]|nr:hypothetical protein BDZ89DRAFT_119560 [Hymenopellis radicata]